MKPTQTFLSSAIAQLRYYQQLGEQTLAQIPEDQFSFKINEGSNSINVLIQHLSGNMLSRWTDFLNSDGEKAERKRDQEFEDTIQTKEQRKQIWDKGWNRLFSTLAELKEQDLEKIVFIRNQGHTVTECINRQLCHYSYHIGQLVLMGKIICGNQWKPLSIPKGGSDQFNTEHFSKKKERKHFLDDRG
jgi:hypothetical protein